MEQRLDETNNPHLTHKTKPVFYVVTPEGCHICTSHRHNKNGYPMKTFHHEGLVTHTLARYVWFLNTGEMLDINEFMMNRCRNKSCINFEHLFVGDKHDFWKLPENRKTRVRHTQLKDLEIREIKMNTTNTALELAEKHHVSLTTIQNIWLEKVFAHIQIEDYYLYIAERRARLISTRVEQMKKAKKGRQKNEIYC